MSIYFDVYTSDVPRGVTTILGLCVYVGGGLGGQLSGEVTLKGK